MAFGFKKKTVRVEFFDSVTEEMIGYDEMDRKALPEDFKVATWVTIAGDKYKVEQVMPAKIKKAIKKGTMTVHLKLEEKAEVVPEVQAKAASLFRQPSKADHSPRIRGKRDGMKLLEMAHSDWRNLEFMFASNRALILEGFEKIHAIIKNASTEQDGKTFYREQHARAEVILPLRGQKLSVEQLRKEFFQFSVDLEGLTFMGETGIADQTFVFRCPSGLSLYGQEFEDIVRYLAIRRPAESLPDMLKADIEKVALLMKKKDLVLVDWETLKIIEGTDADLNAFFIGESIEATKTNTLETLAVELPKAAPIAAPEVITEAIQEDSPAVDSRSLETHLEHKQLVQQTNVAT